MTPNPPRSASLPAGYDEEDPYEGEDLSEYPEWWRENVQLFREHGMRPYRPPRFADGELTPPLIKELEREFDVTILIRSRNPHWNNNWEIWINGDPIEIVEHAREGEGYSQYDIESDEFEELVRANAE